MYRLAVDQFHAPTSVYLVHQCQLEPGTQTHSRLATGIQAAKTVPTANRNLDRGYCSTRQSECRARTLFRFQPGVQRRQLFQRRTGTPNPKSVATANANPGPKTYLDRSHRYPQAKKVPTPDCHSDLSPIPTLRSPQKLVPARDFHTAVFGFVIVMTLCLPLDLVPHPWVLWPVPFCKVPRPPPPDSPVPRTALSRPWGLHRPVHAYQPHSRPGRRTEWQGEAGQRPCGIGKS